MRNEYAFMSNYYPCKVTYNGLTYGSSEAAYQAQKEPDPEKRKLYCETSPSMARLLSEQITMPPAWYLIKDQIMYEVNKAKFVQNEGFKELLLEVSEDIVQENTWNDTYWGVCNGTGLNKFGEILTKIREEFEKEANA